jgi:hypothetical protein
LISETFDLRKGGVDARPGMVLSIFSHKISFPKNHNAKYMNNQWKISLKRRLLMVTLRGERLGLFEDGTNTIN